jgi:hypothetical protein
MSRRYIVKLGGCLVTEKDGFCEPNYARIAKLGQQVQLALGGGTFRSSCLAVDRSAAEYRRDTG